MKRLNALDRHLDRLGHLRIDRDLARRDQDFVDLHLIESLDLLAHVRVAALANAGD